MTSFAAHRHLVGVLVRRDLRLRYSGSLLGVGWALLNPLLTILVFLFAFGYVFQIEIVPNYPLFLTIGILHWHYFSSTMNAGPRVAHSNSDLLHNAVFPRLVLPWALVGSQTAMHAVAMVAFALLYPFLAGPVWPGLIAYPIVLALFALFTGGVATALAGIGVFFRDVESILRVATRLLFWVSPVLYRYERLPPEMQRVLQINPLYPFLEGIRAILYAGGFPTTAQWLGMVGWTTVALLVGTWLYQARARYFVEVV